VLEVIEAVKKVTRADFDVRLGARRAGDPAALVAETRRILEALDWIPRYDDLETIIRHAHAWEADG
jgi:UDP-glucose 4-epimerase